MTQFGSLFSLIFAVQTLNIPIICEVFSYSETWQLFDFRIYICVLIEVFYLSIHNNGLLNKRLQCESNGNRPTIDLSHCFTDHLLCLLAEKVLLICYTQLYLNNVPANFSLISLIAGEDFVSANWKLSLEYQFKLDNFTQLCRYLLSVLVCLKKSRQLSVKLAICTFTLFTCIIGDFPWDEQDPLDATLDGILAKFLSIVFLNSIIILLAFEECSEVSCILHPKVIISKLKKYFTIKEKRINSFEIEWSIDQFSSIVCPFNSCSFLSEKISPTDDSRYGFKLCLFKLNNRDHISLDVHFISEDIDQITARYRISILNIAGNKWERWDKKVTTSNDEKFIIPKLFDISHFQTPPIVEEYLPNDTLTLLCEIKIQQDRRELKTESSILCFPAQPPPPPTLPQIQMTNVNGSYFLVNSISHIDGNVHLKHSSNN